MLAIAQAEVKIQSSLGRITTLFDEDEPVCVEMYGGEVDRSWWTAAFESLLSPEFRRALALRVCSTTRYRPFRPTGASGPMAGVRPALHP